MSNITELNAYDTMPYPAYSFPVTHIGRLGAIGRIFGLNAASPDNARVLELGCSSGLNTLAMAQLFPQAEFVGVDYSARQIQEAEEALAATGLTNVRFVQADIADLGEDLGQFDYIITHGIYSWVPQRVKEAILRISRENLKPDGIAYISYNVLPGWRMRGALRDMMLMHTAGIQDVPGKVAQSKALIKFLAESCAEDTPYGKYLRQELELLKSVDDAYIAHDFLETDNDALYFSDFVKDAAEAKLLYLGDAEPATMIVDNLPKQAADTLKSLNLNLLATEQYMDFVRNRMFRSTLLCHSSAELKRNVDPKNLDGLYVSTLIGLKQPYAEGQPAVFTAVNGGELNVNDAITADIFTRVANLRGASRPVAEIIDETAAAFAEQLAGKDPQAVRADLGRLLIQGYFKKMVDFAIGPASCRAAAASADHPEALPLARWQASLGRKVSSPRLEMLNTDPFVGKFVTFCDGTRDRGAIIDALIDSLQKKEYQLNENNQPIEDSERARFIIEKLYDGSLENLRRLGVVVSASNGDHS
jgi:SAM-dependent methyltransferase